MSYGADEIADMEKEISRLRAENRRLQEHKDGIHRNLVIATEKKHTEERENTALRTRIAELETEIVDRWEHAVDHMDMRIKALKTAGYAMRNFDFSTRTRWENLKEAWDKVAKGEGE